MLPDASERIIPSCFGAKWGYNRPSPYSGLLLGGEGGGGDAA